MKDFLRKKEHKVGEKEGDQKIDGVGRTTSLLCPATLQALEPNAK